MQSVSATDEQRTARLHPLRRPLLGWWPVVTGLALGVASIATEDPTSVDGALLTLLIPTCAYALIALSGRSSWSWPLTGLVAVVHLAGDASAQATWERVYETNILGTRNVLEAG